MLNIKSFVFNPFQTSCPLLWDEDGCGVIVDPGCYGEVEMQRLCSYMAAEKIRPEKILLTHGHFDHIYGVKALSELYDIPVYMHPDDAVILAHDDQISTAFGLKAPDTSFDWLPLSEGDILRGGKISFEVIHTPGHTPGGVCFLDREDGLLLSGDTLFAGSIGRTDNQWGDYEKLIVSIMDKLMGLPSDTDVIPGHGPKTDIGYERTHNPFLQPFNEPDESADEDPDGIGLDGSWI